MVIQHNISSLNAWGNTKVNNNNTAKNLEKLSSGFRVNRAGDDAAGLAISEKMRGQIRGLGMAETNVTHGINLIQTAEGGLNETHAILQRMRELAVQSANGTYHDDVDRENINKEYKALTNEIDRISTSTHYNGKKLLDGSLSKNGPYMLKAESFPTMKVPTDAAVISGGSISGTITQDTVITGNVTFSGDLTVAAGVNLYVAEGAVLNGARIYNEGVIHNAGSISDIYNQDGGVVTNYSSGNMSGVSGFGFASAVYNYGTLVDIVVGSESFYYNWGDTDAVINQAGSNGAGGGAYNYGTISYRMQNLSSAIFHNYNLIATGENLGNALIECYGTINTVSSNFGKINYRTPEVGLTFQIGANGDADQRTTLYVENMGSNFIGKLTDKGVVSVKNSSVRTRERANDAIDVLDGAVNMVSGTRADLGAMQNRLESTLNNLGVTKENLQAAESSIRDVDMAKEMMEFTKNNILAQAAQSMLAQSNQLPQGVLSLLR